MNKIIMIVALLLGLTANAQNRQIRLSSANTVTFRGVVDGDSITKAQLDLAELVSKRGQKDYPIYLVMDSPGGSIVAGLAFIQFAKTLKNVETISISAASMASAIVQALPGKRLVTEDAMLMFHRAAAQFRGYVETGEVESQLAYVKTMVRRLETVNANRIGITLADYKAKVVGEWYIFGAGNITEKTADEVVDIICTEELVKKRDVIVEGFFLTATKNVYSKCPLFRVPLPIQGKEE